MGAIGPALVRAVLGAVDGNHMQVTSAVGRAPSRKCGMGLHPVPMWLLAPERCKFVTVTRGAGGRGGGACAARVPGRKTGLARLPD